MTFAHLDVDAVVNQAAMQGQPAVSMAVKADAIELPSKLNWPLGPHIASVAVDAALNGRCPTRPG